jgi:ABC-2 type transport system permease protein
MVKRYNPLRKYARVISSSWAEFTAYRLNFFLWRVRNVMQILVVYFLWWAIFSSHNVLFGYTQSMMLTYVLLSSIIRSVVLGTRTDEIGDIINEGNLSNFLVRPIDFFRYYIARDLADKALNVLFAIGEISILLVLLRPPLFVQADIGILLLSAIAVMIGAILYFCVSILLGFLGFWIPDFWAPRFLLFILIEFFAGGFFQLDVLPEPFYAIARSLPFSFFLYFPLKVYLGQVTKSLIWTEFAVGLVWVGVLFGVLRVVWHRGLRVYTSERR